MVNAAAQARLRVRSETKIEKKLSADAMLPPPSGAVARTTETIIAIGASTGGTEALRVILEVMPPNCPPIVIVQHMPESFIGAFAQRLDGSCAIDVMQAAHGDRMLRGRALIAPGDRHTMLIRSGATYSVEVKDGPLVARHKPSVDVLFRSVAASAGKNAVGVIMTGMGDDGARGLREMRDAGAATIGQDEASSVIYGMPKEAMKHGGVMEQVPLHRIAERMLELAER